MTAADFPCWLNPPQQDIIDNLQEENLVLREPRGDRRLRLNADQRWRLAVKAQKLGRRVLHELVTFVTPETLLGLAPPADRQEI